MVVVSVTMLHGLYDPRVDNDKIFAIIGPAFQTIVGGFVGLLSGLALGRKTDDAVDREGRSAPHKEGDDAKV